MAAILKGQYKEPVSKWTTREKLILASSVQRSGDQNWVSVSRAIKPLIEEDRPLDYFSQKNCAIQYATMLDKVATPKRKRKEEGATDVAETVEEQIVRHFTSKRIKELDKELAKTREEYSALKKEIEQLEKGELDDRLQTLWEQAQLDSNESKLLKSPVKQSPIITTPVIVKETNKDNIEPSTTTTPSSVEDKGKVILEQHKGHKEESPIILKNTKPLQLVLKKEQPPLVKSPLATSFHTPPISSSTNSSNINIPLNQPIATTATSSSVQDSATGTSTHSKGIESNTKATSSGVTPIISVTTDSSETKTQITTVVSPSRHKDTASNNDNILNEEKSQEQQSNQESLLTKESCSENVTEQESINNKKTQEVIIKQEEEEDVIVDVVKTNSEDGDIKKELEDTPPDTPILHKKRKQESPERIETPPLKEPNKDVVVEDEIIRVKRGRPPGKRSRLGRGRPPKLERRDTPPGEDESEEENLSAFSSAVSSPCPSHCDMDPEMLLSYRNWKKTIMLVWRHAAQHKYANLFLHPVREEDAPGYYDVILRPMDLTTIKKNIENGVIRKDVEFQRDMLLIFQNAFMYNSSDHDVYKMAEEMRHDVMENIQEYLLTQMMVQSSSSKALRSREAKGISLEETKLKKVEDPSPARKRRLRLDD